MHKNMHISIITMKCTTYRLNTYYMSVLMVKKGAIELRTRERVRYTDTDTAKEKREMDLACLVRINDSSRQKSRLHFKL